MRASSRKRRGLSRRELHKENPGLVVLSNPPAGAQLMSRRVLQLEYRHVADPDGPDVVRYHPFGKGVEMWALPDGSVLLKHRDPKKRVWADL